MRITEQSNPITASIDDQPIPEMVRLIGLAEQEIFGSKPWGPALRGSRFVKKLETLRERIGWTLGDDGGKVIIGGAGTSGRLAVQAATLHEDARVVGLIAGGMDAFITAKEGAEDSAEAGRRDYLEALDNAPASVYVGISCGLSAAYVAGQVHEALKKPGATVAVIGFNPLEDADTRPLPEIGGNFKELLQQLETTNHGVLLNPVLGPEPITGSTRMKGGSATRIILDILLGEGPAGGHLETYARLQETLFRELNLADLIEGATRSLTQGSGIVYLAGSREGLMTMLDASECPPTFGSRLTQVQAFVPPKFRKVMPALDVTGLLFEEALPRDFSDHMLIPVSFRPRYGWPLGFEPGFPLFLPEQVRAELAEMPLSWRTTAQDMALKWMLNTFSTCSFIGAGKVFGNRMIDLRISNLKLFDRALRIISELGDVTQEEAGQLVNTIILGEPVTYLKLPEIVKMTARRERVVPTAILMARHGLNAIEAHRLLDQTPILKHCLA
ncbi:MAG: hypothetical protein QNK37_21520 [Acidobacteriota bacterium]|nr:hypothetical protein [Acidobacteriota bacterium]